MSLQTKEGRSDRASKTKKQERAMAITNRT